MDIETIDEEMMARKSPDESTGKKCRVMETVTV
jgi:hypothetical protein